MAQADEWKQKPSSAYCGTPDIFLVKTYGTKSKVQIITAAMFPFAIESFDPCHFIWA